MKFTSTRSVLSLDSASVMARGISEEGGLFVPCSFPEINGNFLKKIMEEEYPQRAADVLSLFMTDFSGGELLNCAEKAYNGKFDTGTPAPVKEIFPGLNVLELWHGPTCAFKDMALQILPHLLAGASRKVIPGKKIVILVATSGDTGKAALDGFANAEGTEIIVFFPRDGVSPVQKLQMVTQEGNNVSVCAVKGNFDDAQSAVKRVFTDSSMKAYLAGKDRLFSSANSINFGRLAPQIVYYISAYCDMVKAGRIAMGDKVNIAVPTGNFGNILAAYYAKRMGLPVNKFICASNRNNVLTDFIRTGTYDRNRPFHVTTSPSMDILISSNLERLLFELYGRDEKAVSGLMDELKKNGKYTISGCALKALQSEFYGGFCDDEASAETIADLFKEEHYLCDPHTSVAVRVWKDYVKETGDKTPVILASTASPYKFAKAVLHAVAPEAVSSDEFGMIDLLSEKTGTEIPAPLAGLKNRKVLHDSCVEKEGIGNFVKSVLADRN